ncbi:MAG: HK97 family phage prohead protease, partial [Actinomycetota bacterium]
RWRASGDPIPIVWSHDWSDPASHVGKADAFKAVSDERGLRLLMKFDLDTEKGAHVFRLVKERRVKEWSFAYDVIAERPAKDGANELLELDIIEAGPTLKGANPLTATVGVKEFSEDADPEACARIDAVMAGQSDRPTTVRLELAKYNRMIDEAASLKSGPIGPTNPAELDAFLGEMKAERLAERAREAVKEKAQRRLAAHAVATDTPRPRIVVDARFRPVVDEAAEEEARRERERARSALEARDAR